MIHAHTFPLLALARTALARTALPALGLLAMLCVPFAPATLAAADNSTAATPMVINTVCPMDGKPIDQTKAKMVLVTIGEGADARKYLMAFCSDECCTEFTKDPGVAFKSWYIGPKGGETRKGLN